MTARRKILLALPLMAAVGCTSMGPHAIREARFNYNEAIVRTWNEQMLLNLVRLRYRDTPFFLEVGSVSTQYRFLAGASAGSIQVPRGSDVYSLGAEVEYAETPTIVYSPLQGDEFVRRLLSPLPVESLVLLSGSGWSVARLLRCCVDRLNDIRNAAGASGPTPAYVPDHESFLQITDLLRGLQLRGAAELQTRIRREGPALVMVIAAGEEAKPDTVELMQLLGLPPGIREIPLTLNPGDRLDGSLLIVPRSTLGAMYYLSQAVQSPPGHRERGLVTVTRRPDGTAFDWAEILGGLMEIRWSETPPEGAFVRVPYRGVWFYIDDADLNSKSTFNLMSQLFNLQAGESRLASPLLTLPLGN